MDKDVAGEVEPRPLDREEIEKRAFVKRDINK